MAIPTYDRFIEPLLRYLAAHPNGVRKRAADDAVAGALRLTAMERSQRLPSGTQAVYQNRSGWAHDRLKRAGLSASPQFGIWQVTKEGLAFVRKYPKRIPDAELAGLARVHNAATTAEGDASDEPVGADRQSPEERIEQATTEIRDSVSQDLLELIGRSPPDFFEKLVLDLVYALGYGITREDLQRVGGSGDGGIDGIISLDRLGFERVYIQAKRWKNKVNPADIQAFYGALAGRRASKGVFITTSLFTPKALEFAAQVDKLVLIDGVRLTRLMIEHGVGVTHKVLKLAKVDADYFDEA